MTNPVSRRDRPRLMHTLALLAAIVVAVAALVLASPGAKGAPVDGQVGMEGAAEAPTLTLPDGTEVVASDLIVNYEAGTTDAQRDSARDATGAALGEGYPDIGTEVVELDRPATSASALTSEKAELEARPGVESVEYDEVSRLAQAGPAEPNDPYFRQGHQGNLRAVGAPRAWNRSLGGVRVGVLDSGCFGTHAELNGGKIVSQHDFYYGDELANDRVGHGTHVASILAANTGNGRGIAGGAPAAEIVCVKVTSDVGSWTTRVLLAGLHYAGNRGAQVINMSLAGGRHRTSIARRIKALSEDGVFLAAAAGNGCETKRAEYPAAYPGVMAVGGTERDGTGRYRTPNGCSNAGPYLDIAAPGESIWGADVRRRDPYALKSGTSMASPHVAAAAALLAARGAGVQKTTVALRQSADDRGPRGEDAVYGAGLVDFDGALTYYVNHQ